MQDCKNVYIFGYSGHAYVLIDSMLNLGHKVLGYFDKNEALKNPYKLEYLGYELEVDIEEIIGDDYVFPTVGENAIREKLFKLFEEKNFNQFTIVDPTANISKTAKVGLSTYIGKSTCVNALSKIGSGVILNTNSVIEHECEIGNFTHIAPSATLAGDVKVGNNSFIGANSVCKQGITIGSTCILGAGSVLLENLPDTETWVGSPAKKIN